MQPSNHIFHPHDLAIISSTNLLQRRVAAAQMLIGQWRLNLEVGAFSKITSID